MINDKTQHQTGGDGSTNYQSAGDMTVNHGPSKEELVEIMSDIVQQVNVPTTQKVPLTRGEVKSQLENIFEENHGIFDKYGPMTDERFNPESELPEQWLRKIQTFILPNNRRIVEICDQNISLLLDDELTVLQVYKQHVDDFEAKHTGLTRANGSMFPAEILNIFGDRDE